MEAANEHLKGHTVPVAAAEFPSLTSPQSHGRPYPLRPLAVKVSVSKKYESASFDMYEQMNGAAIVVNRVADVESGPRHGHIGSP